MSWFSRLFGGGKKPQPIGYAGIRSLRDIPETTSHLLPAYKERMAIEPEDWTEKYYKHLFKPTADEVRGTWGEMVDTPIMQKAGAMGMARSTPTVNRLATELAKRELGLGKYAGELRAKGFETGLAEKKYGTEGMHRYIGDESDTQYRAGMADLGADQFNARRTDEWEEEGAQIIPRLLTTAGNVISAGSAMSGGGGMPMFGMSTDWLGKLLNRQQEAKNEQKRSSFALPFWQRRTA